MKSSQIFEIKIFLVVPKFYPMVTCLLKGWNTYIKGIKIGKIEYIFSFTFPTIRLDKPIPFCNTQVFFVEF